MSDINDEVNAIAEHLRRLNIEFDRYGTLTAQSADAVRRKTAAEQYRDNQLEKSGYAAAQSLQSLGKAVGSAAGAMYEGRQGAAAFNDSIASMNMAVRQAAIALTVLAPGGPLGKIITAGLTALGLAAFEATQKLDEMGRNMLESSYDAYKKLAAAGAATSAGLQGVADSAEKTGVNMLKMDEYLNLIGSNSKTLALFSESVSAGRRDFDNLGQALEGERQKFFALGFTQDTMNDSMMDFVKLQTISGQAQKKNIDQLAVGTKNYLYEQDELTKLTGLTRKEQTAIREQALSEQRFRAKLDAMRASGDERQIKAADELEKANVILASQSPELAQGFRDMQSGAITTAAAQKALISTNGEILKSSQDLQNGLSTAGEASQRIFREGGKFATQMNMSAQLGTFEEYGIKYADLKKAEIFAQGDYNEKIKKILADREKQTGDTPGADPMLERYAKLLRDQQTTMTTLQQAMAKGFEVPILGFVGMGPSLKRVEESVSKAAVEALADYIKAFDAMPPKPRGPLGESKGPVVLNQDQKAALDKSIQVLTDAEVNLKDAGKKLDEKHAETEAARKSAEDLPMGASKKEKLAAVKKWEEAIESEAEVKKQFNKAREAQLNALNEFNLAKQGKAIRTEPPKEKEKAKDNVPPANETEEAKQARIKKETEAAEKSKADAKAAEEKAKKDAEEKAKKDAEDKSKAKETARITTLPGPDGARVLDDVLELVKQGVPVVSNVRTQEEQDKLKDHQDEKGNWFTKNNLPVAEDSKHLTGDAIDVRVKDMTKDLEELLKKSGWMRPLPKSDPGHWQRVPKSKEKKTGEVVPNDVDLAASLAKSFDLSDATAGLTINSDVATLNSKGMNVSLDSSSDVAKLIMEPVLTQIESSQKDQSLARSSFESSIGDLRADMAKQKATDELLLAAVQELIRIQKNGVSVNEKILAAQA